MRPLVIKLGGVILDTPSAMHNLLQAIQTYRATAARPVLIVHGGGCKVDQLLQRLNLPIIKQQGLRVTPKEQIELIVGALAGSANKVLLAQAYRLQLPAIGLCLADGAMIKVSQLDPALGQVGQAVADQPQLLQLLLAQGYLPIISSIGITADGELMNVNADQAAAAIAKLLRADLVLLSDVAAVLDKQQQPIAQLKPEQITALIADGTIAGGMLVKVQAALQTAQTLQRAVTIAGWQDPQQLQALLAGDTTGTQIWATSSDKIGEHHAKCYS